LIFRGADRKYYRNEIAEYDPRIHILFQKKAWADRPTSETWVRQVLHPHIDERTRLEGREPSTILFCDNLDAQVHTGFLDALREKSVCRHLLVAGETEMLQPIDAGIGSVLKTVIGDVQDEWLDEPGNLDAWEGDPLAELKLDAKTRRILITHWVAEAWDRLTTLPRYAETFRKCFMRTGALITADGSEDHEIQPMVGLRGGYKVPEMVESTDDGSLQQQEAHQIAPEEEPDPEEHEVEELDGNADIVIDEGGHDGDTAIAIVDPDTANVASLVSHEAVLEPSGAESVLSLPPPAATDDELDEEESWSDAVHDAFSLEASHQPVGDDCARLPARLTGCYVLIKIDGEWECAKVDKAAAVKRYRYRLEGSKTYGFSDFSNDAHGRKSTIANDSQRWVLLLKC